MATKVVMEALSPTMEEGRLVKWSKNEGDQIKTGDVLAEVETDKAVMELVARGDGVLRKRLANEGDASPVGTLLAVIANADENIDAIIGSAPSAPAAAAGAPSGQTAQVTQPAQGAQSDAAPNQAVTETKESAGRSAVPQTPAQSQGEASTPPQQKAATGQTGVPPSGPARPTSPSPSPSPSPRPSGP